MQLRIVTQPHPEARAFSAAISNALTQASGPRAKPASRWAEPGDSRSSFSSPSGRVRPCRRSLAYIATRTTPWESYPDRLASHRMPATVAASSGGTPRRPKTSSISCRREVLEMVRFIMGSFFGRVEQVLAVRVYRPANSFSVPK